MAVTTYKYFMNPFAVSGDKTTVPETSPPDGSVSWATGYGTYYQQNLNTDPNALAIERNKFNEVVYDISLASKQYQETGTPLYITSSMNGGASFQYSKYSSALYNRGAGVQVFQSLNDANGNTPANVTAWRLNDFSAELTTIDAAIFDPAVVDGNIVYWLEGEGRYKLAVADGTIAQNVIGVADVTNGRVILAGQPALFTGLTVNNVYYLSETIPGAVTSTPPVNNVVRLGIARTSQRIVINIEFTTHDPALVGAVYLAAAQPVNDTVTAKVLFDTTEYDPFNMWDNTNKLWVVPRAGYYRISVRLLMDVPSNGDVSILLYKNGSYFRTLRFWASIAAADELTEDSTTVHLSATDTIGAYVHNQLGGGSIVNLLGTTLPADVNSFEITYVGP
jgi:hypothetical protein